MTNQTKIKLFAMRFGYPKFDIKLILRDKKDISKSLNQLADVNGKKRAKFN
jgi:hypothetical protein